MDGDPLYHILKAVLEYLIALCSYFIKDRFKDVSQEFNYKLGLKMQLLAPASEILLLLSDLFGNLMAGDEDIDDLMDIFFDGAFLKFLDVSPGDCMFIFGGFAEEP